MKVSFFKFRDFPLGITQEIKDAMSIVIDSSSYILGTEVTKFEKAFARHIGVKYCVAVGNGFDAIQISLLSLDIGVGDEVIINSNTIPVTLMAILAVGATPVLADFDSVTGQINIDNLQPLITTKTKAVLPVSLYFQSCDLGKLKRFCHIQNIFLIEDFAHCHDTVLKEGKVGSFGSLSATSFYPTKTLGAIGDAGAIIMKDENLKNKVSELRNYGKDKGGRYNFLGINSRMDDIQASVLNVKLGHFEEISKERKRLYNNYKQVLGTFMLHELVDDFVPHLCVFRHFNAKKIQSILLDKGVETKVHYPYFATDIVWDKCRWSTDSLRSKTLVYSEQMFSLPLYVGMTIKEQSYVISSLLEAIKKA